MDLALSPTQLPRHIAIIMDGNGRWAKQRNLPRHAGHIAGVETVREVVRISAELGIGVLTLFAFSSENWRRPREEVGLLMNLFLTALQREITRLHKNQVQLRIIGDRTALPKPLQDKIVSAETLTQHNTGLKLVIAANYGGHWDLTQAARQLYEQIRAGQITPEDVTQERLGAHTCLANLPDPDLFIRTGGEQRISNFLLWQLAYTELYFTETLWPDFNTTAFQQALRFYATRQRRFGRTGDQIQQDTP